MSPLETIRVDDQDDVLSTFLFAALDQTDHSVDVSEVVPRLRDLGLVGGGSARFRTVITPCLLERPPYGGKAPP
jgi:hypothetical protein